MISFKNISFQGIGSALCGIAAAFMAVSTFTGCSDFLEQESDHVIYSDKDHLSNWPDTVYSVMGILNKLQVIADRTIILGEVRGDLVSLTSEANSDLRDVASFNVQDDNMYNVPRDYYAIINNCNYFIEKADTALKNNRGDNIFLKEYAAVKGIRAWTYLQLALNYGSVPFIEKPILTKEESERNYPRYDLAQICDFFIKDLASLGQDDYYGKFPFYGQDVRGNDSRLFFFPLNIIRGDLYLWLGSTKGVDAGRNDFEQAALCYYRYITSRNGLNSAYPVGVALTMWSPTNSSWLSTSSYGDTFIGQITDERYSSTGELITMIPCDSIRAEGFYSELRNLFVSREENDYKVSISPSQRMIEISEAQANCRLASNGVDSLYAPAGLDEHMSGDLRLSSSWTQGYRNDPLTGDRIETQNIRKFSTRNVHLYRRQQLYLRFAEALNLAGYPRVAFKILSRGLCDGVLQSEVYPYLHPVDFDWLYSNLSFYDVDYEAAEAEDFVGANLNYGRRYSVGIHSRGSGWTPKNDYYRLVGDTVTCRTIVSQDTVYTDDGWYLEIYEDFDEERYAALKKQQQQQVDSLILNECALEMAFEGTRYYDLMRFAMRQPNPNEFLKQHIYARRGKDNSAEVQAEIRNSFATQNDWYLKWNGKIGF